MVSLWLAGVSLVEPGVPSQLVALTWPVLSLQPVRMALLFPCWDGRCSSAARAIAAVSASFPLGEPRQGWHGSLLSCFEARVVAPLCRSETLALLE